MDVKNLNALFNQFDDYWHPRIAGELNNQYVKVAKFKGEFNWHHHDHEDEMFLVVKGSILIHLRDKDLHIGEGEFAIIPRGVEHKPVAEEEAWVVLFEPKETLNTGNVITENTHEDLESL